MSRGATPLRSGSVAARSAPSANHRPGSEYDFLAGRFVDRATLARAQSVAARWGVLPHAAMIATGWITSAQYAQGIAEANGAAYRSRIDPDEFVPQDQAASPRQCLARGLLRHRRDMGAAVVAPEHLNPNELPAMLSALGQRPPLFTTQAELRRAVCAHFRTRLAADAIGALHARYPEQSARSGLVRWQRICLWIGAICLSALLIMEPVPTIRALSFLLALFFLPVIALRFAAIHRVLLERKRRAPRTPRLPDAELPVYTILVPLYREAKVLAPLASALLRLDYPSAKLDIKLILEETDEETIAAARALDLPGNVELVLVPDLGPRTKPKALNYALPLARGDYLVIYDAEDRPEHDQLRKAVAAFRTGAPNLACLQARLSIYNSSDSWLTRQFGIEYCALFAGLLPALDRLALPIPLGGTSNHFRMAALKWVMAWDPFNVTEDADLGTRLARSGYRCAVLPSATFEEAPVRLMPWLKQRTRWLKGYLQTWLVHMRDPAALFRELGPFGFFGFQAMVGGTLLSALVHPWFYVLLAADLGSGAFLTLPLGLLGLPFWILAALNLAFGYAASLTLAALVLGIEGKWRLLRHVPLMPLYWLLVSAAAYRALWQFARDPFTWEKTEHGLARSTYVKIYSASSR